MNYDTIYKKYANKTINWCPMDTKELFEKNLITKIDQLEKFNWVNRSFTYNFNSHGFRTEKFDDKPSIMFLGCSNTMGIGLPLESTWADIVSRKLKLKNVNLGIGGSSPDTAFRMCHGYLNKINPKIVIYLEPPGIRSELYYEMPSNYNGINCWKNLGVGVLHNDIHSWYTKEWAVTDINHYFSCEKNLMAINYLCNKKNTKFYYISSSTHNDFCGQVLVKDLARDLAHHGEGINKTFADYVLRELHSNYFPHQP